VYGLMAGNFLLRWFLVGTADDCAGADIPCAGTYELRQRRLRAKKCWHI